MPDLPRDADPSASLDPPVRVRFLTRQQVGLLVVIFALLLTGTAALVLGPGRGARHDIALMTDDLDASRGGIFTQLSIARTQLSATERSLTIQEQGLQVAVAAEKDADQAARASQQILDQTRQALQLVREVTQALGPLDLLDDKIDSVVLDVARGVRLARSAVSVAEQTLATGEQALVVARETLAALERSEQIQRALLEAARATLQQAREINRKIPGVPIFPSAPSPAPVEGAAR